VRALAEADRVDDEEAALRVEPSFVHPNEAAQPEEEVGKLVVVAVELEGDREARVAARDGRPLRRDRVELDAALAGNPAQLEEDARHGDRGRHPLRQPEELGDTDRRGRLRLSGERAALLDLLLRGGRFL